MKKQTIIKTLLSLALVFMLSVTVSATTLKAQEPSAEFVYGDANGDGVVSAADVLLLRKYMANYDYETGKSTVVLGPPVHSHEFTQQNTDGKYLKSEATKQSPAVYWYSCTCGEKGTETFLYGDALGDYLAPVFTLSSDGNSYAVSGATGGGSVLEIPETHDDLPVVAIANNAFYDNTKIAKVTIPDSVTSIGYSAFEGCSSLTSIVIPNSVISIDSDAFYGCSSLESITIPFVGEAKSDTSNTHFGYIFGATSYSENSSYVPESLKTVVITGGTSIGSSAFRGCNSLMSVTIPDSVTSIGSGVFYGCSSLESITIPFVGEAKSDTSNTHFGYIFGANSYSENSSYVPKSIKTVVITGDTNIDENAFYGCSGLTSVTIPDSVTSIGSYAFYDCSGLTSVTIPDSVTSIGNYAFRYCSGLTSVTIGNGVTSIGSGAFYNCSSLASIEVESGNTNYHSAGNCLIETSSRTLILGCKNSVIPSDGSVKSIGKDAFYGCSDLMSITIPDRIASIGSSAFFGCSGLTSITIPDRVTIIGSSAFRGCSSLESITIPFVGATKDGTSDTHFGYIFDYVPSSLKTVVITGGTSIGSSAFRGCSGLTSVTIPDSVTSIGDYAFSYCSGLTSVTIPDSVTSIGSYAFSGCSGLTSVTIPDSVTSIGSYAFEGCSGLTSVTIPDSVTSIGYDAFYNCSGLTSVHITDLAKWCGISFGGSSSNPLYYAKNLYLNGELVTELVIPDSVTSIGSYAFYGCSGLTSVTIGNGVTSIGSCAFEDCSGITSVTIPDSVTSIGYDAFYNCSGLTSVTIGNGVTSIGYYAFDGCSGLTSITVGTGNTKYHSAGNCLIETSSRTLILGCKNSVIPSDGSVKSIGSYAFRGCNSLMSVTIPGSVESIGSSAFYGCSGLTSVKIPDSVTSIGYDAFYNCSGLTSVTIPDSVTSIGSSAFEYCSKLTSLIFEDTSTWYRTTSSSNWKNKTGGTSTSVTDYETNAKYFKSTYVNYYWYKK